MKSNMSSLRLFDITNVIKKEYNNIYLYRDFIIKYLYELNLNYGISLSDISYASSSCSDELNRKIDNINIMGSKFILGGIGGYPHTGKTGIIAFCDHIEKENGVAFIFYGPHIGITEDGRLGKVLRPSQSQLTHSCGSLNTALEKFKKDYNYKPDITNGDDAQQMMLEHKLSVYKERFLSADNPIKEITEVAYEIIEKEIYILLEMCEEYLTVKYIALLGGIIINTSPLFNDYVDVRKTDVIKIR